MSIHKLPIKQNINDKEFEEFSKLFYSWTGNKVHSGKRLLFESRLLKYISSGRMSTREYLDLIQQSNEDREDFINALTTHKTDWFREPIHFEFIKSSVQKNSPGRSQEPLLIWSAACSTGEEVYSTALSLNEIKFFDYRILGTDISEHCVKVGQSGLYLKNTVDRQVPGQIVLKNFLKSSHPDFKNQYKVDNLITDRTKWRTFNLLDSTLPNNVQFDFIILRNVLIYFDEQTIQHVVSRLFGYLKNGGYFIIGLSENIPHLNDFSLTRMGNSIFKKWG